MKKLLLLHGTLGSSAQFEPLKKILSNQFELYTPEFSGHGGKQLPGEAFTIEMFAKDVVNYLDQHAISAIDVFGYSMGGYVALYVAKHFPGKINSIVTLATKFNWNKETAINESKMLDATIFEKKIPAYAQDLALRHGQENWKKLVEKTAELIAAMGINTALSYDDLKSIDIPVMVTVGDADKMVSVAETLKAAQYLKKGQSHVFKTMQHPLERINVDAVAALTIEWINNQAD